MVRGVRSGKAEVGPNRRTTLVSFEDKERSNPSITGELCCALSVGFVGTLHHSRFRMKVIKGAVEERHTPQEVLDLLPTLIILLSLLSFVNNARSRTIVCPFLSFCHACQ